MLSNALPIEARFDAWLFDDIYVFAIQARFFLICLAVTSVLMWFPGDYVPSALLWVGRIGLPLYVILVALLTWQRWRKLSAAQRAMTWRIGVETVELNDDAASAITFPWTTVKAVDETSRVFVFRFTTGGLRYLPKRALSMSQTDTLRHLIGMKRTR